MNNNNENIEIKMNQSDYSVSFYIIIENKIALAELSYMDSEGANLYLEMNQDKSLTNIIEKTLEKSERILFFNRLNVPLALRKKGYGRDLLKEVLNFCDQNNIFLVNTENNYGEMGKENLINFYQKYGMKLIHKDGLLIYHSSLSTIKENKIKLKK